MIVAAIVAPREIDQFAAYARRTRLSRQLPQLPSHLAVMIAVGQRRPCFAHGRANPRNERVTGRPNNRTIAVMARQY